jgi:DNA polymerase III, delta subunit
MEYKGVLLITKTTIRVQDYIVSLQHSKAEKWLDFDTNSKKEIDELIANVYMSYPDKTNLYLGDLASLSLNAQQACLKLIEEPPINLQIYISSENLNQVLSTIISRCIVKQINDSDIIKFLEPELLDNCSKKFPPASEITKLILSDSFTIEALGDLSKVERNELKFYLWQVSFNIESVYRKNQDARLGFYLDNIVNAIANLDANLQKKIALVPLI